MKKIIVLSIHDHTLENAFRNFTLDIIRLEFVERNSMRWHFGVFSDGGPVEFRVADSEVVGLIERVAQVAESWANGANETQDATARSIAEEIRAMKTRP